MLLKKASNLDIKMICPLHGSILKENLGYYIEKYDIWSSYKAENEGVTICYASIHGNTADTAKEMAKILEEKGTKVSIFDLARCDMAEVVEDAFRYDKLIIAASSYNAEVFPPMDNFLRSLKGKNYQNRKVGIIENGTWAPSAAKCMKEIVEGMKDITICEPVVTVKSRLKEETREELLKLAENILK